ncbi:unnamed protein product [Cladocopium goreaui]|uniref:Uncharacterized protein n=1 Tax=Cladocopium goreaui TaxID=2562237 RepID=A0A9P1C0H9_9DINO|nr:unnamed protein product [Cladocopium goreaui]
MLTAEAAPSQSDAALPMYPGPIPELGPGRSRLESKVLDVEMDQCAQHLMAIAHTTEVAKAVVAVLADAGSRLQRCSTSKLNPELGKDCEEAMSVASRSFLDACGGLGAVLIGMASAISQNVMLPLESFHRNAFADHARKAKALEELRRKELSCSNAVTEALQKRDRARVGLQSAMRDQEKTEKKATEKKKSSLASRFRDGEKDMAAAELKVHKAATAQTASIEELAIRTEEANEARVVRETASKDVRLLQSNVDFVRSRLLARCLKSSAGAWAEAAKEIQQGAEKLRVQVSKLRSSLDGAPGRTGLPELPSWAMEALKLSKSRPFTLSELNLDDNLEEDHPESPFTAPSPSLRSPIAGSPLLDMAAQLSSRDGTPAQFIGWFAPASPNTKSTPNSTPFD